MPKLVFKSADKSEVTVEAQPGDSIMHIARQNNVPGISAECGGEMMCATCHCYVDEQWLPQTGQASEEESELLEFASSPVTEASRLSCQLQMTDALDGMVVHIPESQV